MGKSKAKEVAPDDDDEALEEDTSIEGKWSLEERQRVAERIEASGTPLGLPDAAFDAPSMVQDAYDAMIQKSPGVEVMMEAILQAARRMDAENWQRFQQIPLLHVHQDDSTVHSNLFAQNEPSWRPLLQRPKKRKQSCAFLHMGTAPMTPVLADFLTKLGWSGICVGPMKPPPGNEDLLQFVQLDPAEAKDQFQIDELLGETGGLVPSPPTFPLAFVNVLFNVNEDSSLLDPYDDDYEEKLKERQEQEAAEAEAKKATGKKKKKDTVVQENAELPPVPPSTVAGYGVVGLTRHHWVRRRLRAIKNCLAITLGRLAKDGSLVMVWPGLPLHPVLFFIAGSLRKLFQRVHVFSPEGSKTFEVYILAAGYKRDKADSKVPGMGGLEIRSFFEDTWRCDGLDDVLLWTLAPLEEDEETNIGLTGKSSVMSYTQLWKTWGTKLTSLALDLGMLLGQDDGAAAAMVKKGSKGTPPTRSKKAKAKEKPKVKQPKAVAVSEEPSIRHFDASQSLGSTADAVSTASPATAPVQAPPAASQPPPTAEAAAAPAESVAPVGPAETGASASAAATPAAPQATSTEPQSTQPPTAELPAGPTPAGPAGVRRRAAPGTRLPPMQDGDPLESELAPRKRRFMLKRGLPALSCSLGAAPGHKYRRPDYQELANQHPLIHKALEVARHGKQKHWDLDGEESNGPRGSIAWNLEELKDSKDPKAADPVPDAAIPTAAETSATNAEPAPEISAGQELKADENHVGAE